MTWCAAVKLLSSQRIGSEQTHRPTPPALSDKSMTGWSALTVIRLAHRDSASSS